MKSLPHHRVCTSAQQLPHHQLLAQSPLPVPLLAPLPALAPVPLPAPVPALAPCCSHCEPMFFHDQILHVQAGLQLRRSFVHLVPPALVSTNIDLHASCQQ